MRWGDATPRHLLHALPKSHAFSCLPCPALPCPALQVRGQQPMPVVLFLCGQPSPRWVGDTPRALTWVPRALVWLVRAVMRGVRAVMWVVSAALLCVVWCGIFGEWWSYPTVLQRSHRGTGHRVIEYAPLRGAAPHCPPPSDPLLLPLSWRSVSAGRTAHTGPGGRVGEPHPGQLALELGCGAGI